MLNQFRVRGNILEIGDIKEGESDKGKLFYVLDFILKVRDREDCIKFTISGKKKVDNFLRYNDISQDVVVFFSVYANKYKDDFINNLIAYRVWTVPSVGWAPDDPIFPNEMI